MRVSCDSYWRMQFHGRRQFPLRARLIAGLGQRHAQMNMRLREMRIEANGALKRLSRSRKLRKAAQDHAKCIVCFSRAWAQRNRARHLLDCARAFALKREYLTKQHMRISILRVCPQMRL